MKYLLDSEILNWNDRLKNTDYMVGAPYGVRSSAPHISFRQVIKNRGIGDTFTMTLDPTLDFQFSFSVAKNRVDLFWDIFHNWYEEKIGNEVLYTDGNNNQKFYEVKVTEDIITEKKEIPHSILNKEYIKYSYKFKGKLSSIMAYVMFLEDTIDIFSKLYGYTEDGQEVNLTKFQIGSIVSKVDDKSKDYLVVDIYPQKMGLNFYIDYHITEVLTIGEIIRYGSTQKVSENEICFSRNSRIDDILDN